MRYYHLSDIDLVRWCVHGSVVFISYFEYKKLLSVEVIVFYFSKRAILGDELVLSLVNEQETMRLFLLFVSKYPRRNVPKTVNHIETEYTFSDHDNSLE